MLRQIRRLAFCIVSLAVSANAQNTFPASGDVGIGTTAPDAALDVHGKGDFGVGRPEDSPARYATPLSTSGLEVNLSSNSLITFGESVSGSANPAITMYRTAGGYRNGTATRIYQPTSDGELYFQNGTYIVPYGSESYTTNMAILGNGNVGIGTANPLKKLHIAGDVEIDGQLFFGSNPQGQAAAFYGCTGADYAESVDVTGDRTKYEPGDVLVIDPRSPGKFLKSNDPYSTMAAGIYSTKPGYVGRLREANDPASASEIPMAMLGRVPTKVTAENGPIQVGDLLVTSSTVGYAMKGTDRNRLTGAVIGKALGSLDSGTGMMMVLVTLQ